MIANLPEPPVRLARFLGLSKRQTWPLPRWSTTVHPVGSVPASKFSVTPSVLKR
jgi:hypothetical protein